MKEEQKKDKDKRDRSIYLKLWRTRNKERIKIYNNYERKIKGRFSNYRQNGFSVTEKDFYLLLEKQNYCCGVCGKKFPRKIDRVKNRNIQLDHCHKTKKVRGILCSSCNVGIGMLNEDVSILLKAIAYLKKGRL